MSVTSSMDEWIKSVHAKNPSAKHLVKLSKRGGPAWTTVISDSEMEKIKQAPTFTSGVVEFLRQNAVYPEIITDIINGKILIKVFENFYPIKVDH